MIQRKSHFPVLTRTLYLIVYNHTSFYQFKCPECKAKYIGMELRLNEHSIFRTSAAGKHLYESTSSLYCEVIQHFSLFRFETYIHWCLISHQFSLYFKEHSNHRRK